MSEEPKVNSEEELQFDKAVPAVQAQGQTTCTHCQSSLVGEYFAINGDVVCAFCKQRIEKEFVGGSPFGRVIKAFALGIPAGMIGAGIYYAISALTGYEFGLISILIGYMVGFAVRLGAQHRGGLPYQIIAVLITYMAICSTYVPPIIEEWKKSSAIEVNGQKNIEDVTQPEMSGSASETVQIDSTEESTPGAITASNQQVHFKAIHYIVAFILSLTIPFMMGFSNVIGILIIAFGIFQAWQLNRKVKLNFEGPFELKTPTTE
ncbi:MAG: hypothetical protein H6753_03960 [Candidatus Omnitrophica bacterium]|nr:hypothetical protein [Candidatus Omnitrophota bacterium]